MLSRGHYRAWFSNGPGAVRLHGSFAGVEPSSSSFIVAVAAVVVGVFVPSRDSKSEERLATSIGEEENTVLPRASCQSADGRVQVVDDLSCFGTDAGLYGLHVFLAHWICRIYA